LTGGFRVKFGIGAALRRKEDPALLTGRGRYVADIRPHDTAWAHVLRSPVAHASFTLSGIDEARAMPGVLAVLTATDFDHLGPIPCRGLGVVDRSGGAFPDAPHYPVMADRMARYVGEAVALVVAETPAAARDAAEAIEIDFQERPAVADIRSATADDAPQIWPDFPGNIAFDWQIGDAAAVSAAFAKADRIITLDLVNSRLVTNYMEPRGAIGEYEHASGRYTLTAGTQGANPIHHILTRDVLKIDREKLRVITPDVGGGFGTKLMLAGEYAMVLVAAKKIGRPITWIADRTEHFLADYQGRSHLSHAELALDGRGRFLALRVDTLAEMGSYFSQMGPFIPTNGAFLLPGIYRIPAIHARMRGVFTNTVPLDAYRGAGRPEAAFLIERLVDKAARETGIAPDRLRRRNVIPPSKMPFRTATGRIYDTGEFDGHMRQAMEVADWAGFRARARAARRTGKLRGIGMATYIEACSGGGPERATAQLAADGTVTVAIGSQSTGQGHATAYAQIVSEHLGIDPEKVTVIQGDTDLVMSGSGTGGSRSIPVGGAALSETTRQLAERIRAIAADMLETGINDLEFDGGKVRIVGTDRAVDLGAIAARAEKSGEVLRESEKWTPPVHTFPNGTHVVEVEIDAETCAITVVRYTVVDDFGVTLNPLLLEGQIHGGIAQGLGQALLERTVHDPETGQLITATLQDYALPRAADLPDIHFETRNVPSTTNALGMKGAGEAGTIGATPAIVNAVVDALHREAGITHIDMPITSEAVWRALNGR
jgi:aerobic carbon-monoxide dehydrogenase large subunit